MECDRCIELEAEVKALTRALNKKKGFIINKTNTTPKNYRESYRNGVLKGIELEKQRRLNENVQM